jgi:hypothetical protein
VLNKYSKLLSNHQKMAAACFSNGNARIRRCKTDRNRTGTQSMGETKKNILRLKGRNSRPRSTLKDRDYRVNIL